MQAHSTASPIADPEDHGIVRGVTRAWEYVARAMRGLLKLIGNALVHDEGLPGSDRDLSWTSLSRFEHDNSPSEVDKLSLSSRELPKLKIDEHPPRDLRFM